MNLDVGMIWRRKPAVLAANLVGNFAVIVLGKFRLRIGQITMKFQQRMRVINTAARSAIWVLLVAILSGPALAETGTEKSVTPAASAPVGDAVFPSMVDPKYEQETPAKARVHTCIDQYNKNKLTSANGGLKWIEKGGGYYIQCNTRLGGHSPRPTLSQEGEEADRDSAMARGASYTIGDNPASQSKAEDATPSKCVYRNDEKLLCLNAERIAFEKRYWTRDFDFLVISGSFSGSGNRWWDWKLIIEDGKGAITKPLADNCLACDIRVDRLNFQSNEIVFIHRQEKRLEIATFRAGQFTLQKSKLDPREPLDEDTCGDLLGRYEYCSKAERNTVDCSMALANSGHFSLLRIEDQYAGISYDGMQRMCRAACSGGKAMDRKTFLKEVCRR
ncbi:hypothetical protein [Bradyrhizobium sp. 6(2017)]|uniref:hypothetical protein n=1 Tax=Bradyrhizobium sp. 6(2017) TaxID=1197460 RepID=UPI0013E17E89|nr:hypothetical protein G6P99_32055 [Bradyrhizobium sp. 6(2017)]